MVFSRDNDAEKDITIVASVRLDDDAVAEILGSEYTEADVKKLVWEEVDKINEEAPFLQKNTKGYRPKNWTGRILLQRGSEIRRRKQTGAVVSTAPGLF